MDLIVSRAPRYLYMTPASHSADPIVAEIDKARHSVHVAIYALTLHAIIDSLISARKRGLEVTVIVDHLQSLQAPEAAALSRLRTGGVRVLVDFKRIMHDKLIVIDGRISIHGSFNFSAAAEHEQNIYVIDHSWNAATVLERVWNRIYAEAVKSQPGRV